MTPNPARCALALAALLPSAVFAQYAGAAPPPADLKTGFDAVTKDLAQKHLAFLAGPVAAGRGSGQPGYQAAAEYVAAQFKEMGLLPIGDGGTYFQGVPFYRTSVDPEATRLKGPGIDLKPGKSLSVSASSDVNVTVSKIVFVSMRSDAEVPADLDLSGKGVFLSLEGEGGRAAFNLSRRGPAFVINVVDKVAQPEVSVQPRRSGAGGRFQRGPTLTMDRKSAFEAARAAGVDPAVLTLGGADGNGMTMHEVSAEYTLTAKLDTEEVMVPNVVGMLPGSDPVLKEQYIGVGAHLDHLGVRNGTLYPGADDDGSGSTAMLLVAKATTANPIRPNRSIVFMAFCGEEMGLIGSGYYTENPIIPLDKMNFLLQMDMVGRNEEFANPPESASDNVDSIHLVGSKRISTQLHDLTLESNKYINFKFEYDEEDVYERSDHANFARKGVPITFLFSGFHPDYHQPTDTIDKINFDKIVSAARLNYLVLGQAGSWPEMVKRDVKGG